MLAAWIVTSTRELCGFASSNSIVPPKSLKRPRTLLSRWRTWKATSEWLRSISSGADGGGGLGGHDCLLLADLKVGTTLAL